LKSFEFTALSVSVTATSRGSAYRRPPPSYTYGVQCTKDLQFVFARGPTAHESDRDSPLVRLLRVGYEVRARRDDETMLERRVCGSRQLRRELALLTQLQGQYRVPRHARTEKAELPTRVRWGPALSVLRNAPWRWDFWSVALRPRRPVSSPDVGAVTVTAYLVALAPRTVQRLLTIRTSATVPRRFVRRLAQAGYRQSRYSSGSFTKSATSSREWLRDTRHVRLLLEGQHGA
jgi:hypothetical protein